MLHRSTFLENRDFRAYEHLTPYAIKQAPAPLVAAP
jgi:hypothetical protein